MKFNWDNSFLIDFCQKTGNSKGALSTKRYLADMKEMYNDIAAADEILSRENPLVYEFYELGAPENDGDLAFGTSIVYPGKVGNEYFMTKGHFHTILDRAEVYYTLSGSGCMLMENPEGDVEYQFLTPGQAVYVPKRFAHRSINIGTEPLVTFFVFGADAGHDYGTIEEKGFRKIVVEENDSVTVKPNPNW